jgi:hypothetical protein
MESPQIVLAISVGMSALDAVDGSSTGTEVPWMWVLLRPHDSEEPNMQAVTTIGLDIAKSVFQTCGRASKKKPRNGARDASPLTKDEDRTSVCLA